jgi:hypothetical protein
MHEHQAIDFALVSTYVPICTTILKALLLTCCAHLARGLPVHVVSAATLLVVYMDTQAQMRVYSSHIVSHLMPVAFFLLTHATETQSPQYEVSMLVDATWACICVLVWASNVFRWRFTAASATALVNGVMVVLHLYYSREGRVLWEVCVRITIFYLLCFVHYHAFVSRVSCDANVHAFLGPHVCLYVLFLQRYAVLGVVCFSVLLLCRMWTGDTKYDSWTEEKSVFYKNQRKPLVDPPQETGADTGSMDELLSELRQAQACRV